MNSESETRDSHRPPSAKQDEAEQGLSARPVSAGLPTPRDDGPKPIGRPLPLSVQDEIVTPAPFTSYSAAALSGERPGRASPSLRLLVGLCLLLSSLSLALSGYLFFSLLRVRQTVHAGLDTAIQAIDRFDGGGLQYEYRFERTVPVSASIPIRQELVFPFRGEIPIDTEVQVPINAGILGTFNVKVPIDTTVTVDTSIPVKVDQRFEVSTTVPISMTIPIDIEPDDPAIQELLNQVRTWLVQLQQSF